VKIIFLFLTLIQTNKLTAVLPEESYFFSAIQELLFPKNKIILEQAPKLENQLSTHYSFTEQTPLNKKINETNEMVTVKKLIFCCCLKQNKET